MKTLLVLFVAIAVAMGQGNVRRRSSFSNSDERSNQISFNGNRRLPCELACSTTASFTAAIDNAATTARCTDSNSDPASRCSGCCQIVALAGGTSTNNAAGFPSTNGRSCVCCIRTC